MSIKAKLSILVAISLWASAFVGIKIGLNNYSPEGLALLRYIVASIFMGMIYFRHPNKNPIKIKDSLGLFIVGIVGIGIYNITLNYGERSISSGMASFITSQTPIVTTILAVALLGEKLKLTSVIGLLVSVFGVLLISIGELGFIQWDASLIYILLATLAGGCYSVLQKPFLNKYHVIEATTFVIWGGTLFLLFYMPHLQKDMMHASLPATVLIVYLGIFPAGIGYLAWSYALAEVSAARVSSFLYAMPFIATLLGWLFLNEVPMPISFAGALLAILGVWLLNQAYKTASV